MRDGHYHQVLADLRGPTRDLRHTSGSAWNGFAQLHAGAMDDGTVLPVATKELIALSIAVIERCDGCIASHARGAARAGATEGEVAEALGVALLMGGGPASIYAPRAWEAYHEFAADVRVEASTTETGAATATPLYGEAAALVQRPAG